MFCFVILIVIMAGFDDDDFSLSGLMQEGHDFVMVIESSSSDEENYHGLLECACRLAGESDKSSVKGGMQGGVMQAVMDQDVMQTVSNLLIPKMSHSGLFASKDMPSSSSQVLSINNVFKFVKFACKDWLKLLFLAGFPATAFFFVMLLSHDGNAGLSLVRISLS